MQSIAYLVRLNFLMATCIIIFIGNSIEAASPHKAQIVSIIRQAPTLDQKVLSLGLKAYNKFQKTNTIERPVITIIDYSKPSSERRLWVLNLKKNKVILHDYVGHGKNSGPNKPNKFSNRKDSFQSSIGVFLTARSYFGNYGYA